MNKNFYQNGHFCTPLPGTFDEVDPITIHFFIHPILSRPVPMNHRDPVFKTSKILLGFFFLIPRIESCIEKHGISAYHVPSRPARSQRNMSRSVPKFSGDLKFCLVPFQFPDYKICLMISDIGTPTPCSLSRKLSVSPEIGM